MKREPLFAAESRFCRLSFGQRKRDGASPGPLHSRQAPDPPGDASGRDRLLMRLPVVGLLAPWQQCVVA